MSGLKRQHGEYTKFSEVHRVQPGTSQEWALFNIQVWDDDDLLTFGDDEMSNKETVFVQPGLIKQETPSSQ